MTDTLRTATEQTKGGGLGGVAQSEAADRLKAELQEYAAAQAQRLLTGLGRRLGESTVKLNDIAEGNSPGFARLALDGGRKLAEGKGPLRSALEVGASRATEHVRDTLENLRGSKGKGRGRGGAGRKPTVIMEYVDVGVPLRTAYDQWTQYQEFSTFAKGVKNANRADDTTSDWQLKVFWASRSWKAHTTEQVPDDRISWTSEGAKGTTKGVVSFHPLAENLTRVLLIIEYYPKGLFEKTGNLWRAQGRRARLDLKHFARYVTLRGEAGDGWRGEIRDGEVLRTHEDAVAEETDEGEDAYEAEAQAEGEADGAFEAEEAEEGPFPEDEDEEYAEEEEVEEPEEAEGDEPEDEYEPEGEYEPEDAYEPAEHGSSR
jgi:hypothetical protein